MHNRFKKWPKPLCKSTILCCASCVLRGSRVLMPMRSLIRQLIWCWQTIQKICEPFAVGASVVVLNHVPSSTKLEGFSCDSLLTPFQQLADIAIANCAEKEGIAAEDIGNLGCFSRGEDLVIHARAAIRGHDRHFDADAEIAVQPLRNLALDAIPNRLTGVAFVASYLRSWQKNVSSTCLRRGAGDTLVVEAIAMRKGEIALQRAIDDATKNAARHLAAATVS